MSVRKQNFIDKMEKKIGRYAIPDLMKYISILYVVGTFLEYVGYGKGIDIYNTYLSLDFNAIFHGQIWRVFTFVIAPPRTITGQFDIFWIAIEIILYLSVGRSIENAIGTFRFNLYYFCGLFFNLIVGLVFFVFAGVNNIATMYYVNRSMIMTFAFLYPNVQFLLFFFLPIKAKVIGIIDGILIAISIFFALNNGVMLISGGYTNAGLYFIGEACSIFASILNFLIFWYLLKKGTRHSRATRKKSKEFKLKMNEAIHRSQNEDGSRHRCCVCGRTELDDENLQFRYCSKCKGNREYCSEHLFTHEHVK